MVTAFFRILLYAVIIILPVILVTVLIDSTDPFLYELGRNTALAGFMILICQVVLASRFKWIERAFGLDILLRFHKHMAVAAAVLLLLHPLLLSAGRGDMHLLIPLAHPWFITLGRVALALILINVVVSMFRARLNLKFETWRLVHDIFGPIIVLFAFIHSILVGHDMQHPFMRTLWFILLIFSLLLFAWHRIIRPWRLKQHPWRVIDVQPESSNVWTVKLAPPEGGRVFDYLPGQFQFITFYRDRNLPVEEHHWTISSSPTEKNYVSSTIKALGDFTSTIKDTRPGDTASVHAPFGRFSYVLNPPEAKMVFVAGGIGITPLMSMLRHMRDTGNTRSVTLFYGNPDTDQIVFQRELSEMEAGGKPALKVIHVLSASDENWHGERGHINVDMIMKYTGQDLTRKLFFICGPLPLINGITAGLMERGVPHRQIRIEIFTLVD